MNETDERLRTQSRNIDKLVKELQSYKYRFDGMHNRVKVEIKLKQYQNIVKDELNTKERYYIDGFTDALKYVLSAGKEDNTLMQKEEMYGREHRIFR